MAFGRYGAAANLFCRLALANARPQPKRSLEERLAMLPLKGAPVSRPVTISWNEHQIPFIEAQTDDDLSTALGVVHAHLRLGQMELMRRLAQGRVCEMVGRLGLDLDRLLRTFDIGRAVPQILASMPAETRTWLEGFARGINHCLDHAPELPREFALLDLKREAWGIADLVTLGRLIAADVNWIVWLRLLKFRARPGLAAALAPPAASRLALFPKRQWRSSDLRRGQRIDRRSAALGKQFACGVACAKRKRRRFDRQRPASFDYAAQSMAADGDEIAIPSRCGPHGPGNPLYRHRPQSRRSPGAAPASTLRAATSSRYHPAPRSVSASRNSAFAAKPTSPSALPNPHGDRWSAIFRLFRSGKEKLALRWMGHRPSDEFTAMLAAGEHETGTSSATPSMVTRCRASK